MSTQDHKNLVGVISKAWSDPTFKERLKLDPRTVLSEMGVQTPGDVEIEVVENTEWKTYLTLPMSPSVDPVTEQELELIGAVGPQAGISTKIGGCCSCFSCKPK